MKVGDMTKSNDLEKLKQFMIDCHPSDIDAWNACREIAKADFTRECISQLDSSRLVKKLVK